MFVMPFQLFAVCNMIESDERVRERKSDRDRWREREKRRQESMN